MKNKMLFAALLGLLSGPALAQDHSITLAGHNQQELGTASITYAPTGTLIEVELKAMSEGWHGVHVHEIGDCSSFEAAGDHEMNQGSQKHGFLDETSPHFGDLPNIWVNATGNGKAQFFSTAIDRTGLTDGDGSALMIHDGADDYRAEPSGGSGDRVACGVIAPKGP